MQGGNQPLTRMGTRGVSCSKSAALTKTLIFDSPHPDQWSNKCQRNQALDESPLVNRSGLFSSGTVLCGLQSSLVSNSCATRFGSNLRRRLFDVEHFHRQTPKSTDASTLSSAFRQVRPVQPCGRFRRESSPCTRPVTQNFQMNRELHVVGHKCGWQTVPPATGGMLTCCRIRRLLACVS